MRRPKKIGMIAVVLIGAGCFGIGHAETSGNGFALGELADTEIAIIDSPPTPPPGYVRPLAPRRGEYKSATSKQLAVPTSTWTYGCTATSAGMIFAYYDRNGYPDMYTGPANGGVCPITDLGQGDDPSSPIAGACSIIATQKGFDGRTIPGHVDDYWIRYGSNGPDPWQGLRAEHTWGECTADYMGTNQWKWDFNLDGVKERNTDGGTSYFYYRSGDRRYDCIPDAAYGLPQTEACHGMRLFAESRGYAVRENYTQMVDTLYSGGFSFTDYMAEIDAGLPVMIHVEGHTMVGVGYDTVGKQVYLHDTWDNYIHSMTWGNSYAGKALQAITIIHLEPSESGAIRVLMEPASARDAGAQWRVDGGTWQDSGATTVGLNPGNHTVSFKTVTGFAAPKDQTVSVTARNTTSVTGAYTQLFGSLTVTLQPKDACAMGAQWQVDGGLWQNSGATLANLPAVQHTVSFKEAPDYTAPPDQVVAVEANITTHLTGAYTPTTGSLTVMLHPPDACSAGAQWQMDGGPWQDSGTNLTKVSVGQRHVIFKTVSGWTAPMSVTVTVIAGQVHDVQAGYARDDATGDIQDILLEGFEAGDKNGDGRLTYDEASALAPGLDHDVFNALDENHDGYLSEEELGGAPAGCGCSSTKNLLNLKRSVGDLFLIGISLLSLLAMAPCASRKFSE